MRDAVADILLERAGVDGSRSAAIALSVALHVSIALLAVLSARSADPSPRHVMNLRLSAVPRGARSPSPPGVATPRRFPAPTVSKAIPKPQAAPVVAPPEAAAVRTEVHQKSLFGKATRPVTPRVAPVEASPGGTAAPTVSETEPVTIGAALPAIGSAGVTAVDGGDFPFDTYLSRMVSLVGTHWFRPQTRGDALVVVNFVIDRDGNIRDARIEKSSGSSLFDRAALRSVVEASPLPPLPFAFQGTFLGVHLTFH
ncbi:MAG TPA: TonB family protein [Thermoanaerobaculia bacterium]|nr:TonB family protein [Thermoanaerobaculia bacterium]